ncbi:MAG: PhoH family protein [Clostridia bacterium]|nr:PhoH family protein [Clostridia bacterium]
MEEELCCLTETHELALSADTMDAYIALFGLNDQNISVLEQECSVQISLRGSRLQIRGDEEHLQLAEETLRILFDMIRRSEPIDRIRIRYIVTMVREGNADRISESLKKIIAVTHRGKQITCKTIGQQIYVDTIRKNTLTFAVGPAGTGKTYLAMALAVMALKSKEAERIILTRPAVEAGEKLGFLPGDLAQKVDPYLRPLYDAMYDFMGPDSYTRLLERGTVEVAPLAYMRGRTLSDAYIILDEAQNTTSEQMKMFLTRIGFNSKVIVTGDITQTDLPSGKKSGLAEAIGILQDIPGIGIVELTAKDIVRHELVQRIVEAYEARDKSRQEGRESL